jgi:hypothetical protein
MSEERMRERAKRLLEIVTPSRALDVLEIVGASAAFTAAVEAEIAWQDKCEEGERE